MEQGIHGLVMDCQGAYLPGVTVALSKEEEVTVTDGTGRYHFHHVEPGDYKVKATMPGFEEEVKETKVEAGEDVDVNFTLTPVEKEEEAEAQG